MKLSEWAAHHPDDIKTASADPDAVEEMIAVAERELLDAASVRSPEGRLGHAHNATLATAAAALILSGYRMRSGSRSHHLRLIDSLAYTMNLEETFIKELQDYRRKRSLSIYERTGVVTDREAECSLDTANRLLREFRSRFRDMATGGDGK